MLSNLSNQEVAILFATRVSENAQTVEQLARNAETSVENARETLASLAEKDILEPIESYDGVRYIYSGSDYAQAIYDEIYGPLV